MLGTARIVEPVQKKTQQSVWTYEFYRAQCREMEEEVRITAEDTALVLFSENGGSLPWQRVPGRRFGGRP